MFMRSREVPEVWKMDMSLILESSSSEDDGDDNESEAEEEEEDNEEEKRKKHMKDEVRWRWMSKMHPAALTQQR